MRSFPFFALRRNPSSSSPLPRVLAGLATFGAVVLCLSSGACSGAASESATPVAATDGGAEGGSSAARGPAKPGAADAGPKTWCDLQGAHDLCADFDSEFDLFHGFNEVVRGDDPAHRDEAAAVSSDRSAPYALHEKGDALPSPEGGQDPAGPFSGTFLVRSFGPTKSTKAHLAWDFRVDQNDDILGHVFELEGRTADDKNIVFAASLSLTTDKSFLAASNGTVPGLPPIASGRWVHVEVALDDLGTGAGTATMSFDGSVVGSVPFTGKLADAAGTKLYLGVSRTAPSGAYDIRYDNVVFDMH